MLFSSSDRSVPVIITCCCYSLILLGTSALPDRTHAFYARKTNHMPQVPVNTVIIYEQVILNHGGFYNENVGQYIAPLTGIYIFIMNAVTMNANTYIHIVHNGQEVSRAWSVYSNGNHSGSMMAILILQQTDEVHTVLMSGYSLHGEGWSHWGGFLLATL